MLRKPAVAGMFYPDDSEELVKTIEDCFLHSLAQVKSQTLNLLRVMIIQLMLWFRMQVFNILEQ